MSIEEQVECPLCMEPLELDDLNFYPCTCGYQICRFCWHRIRTDENGLCPACRKAYPEDPAEFKPLTEDEFSCHRLQRIKRERKVKDLQRKQKAAENRKHLANVRVVQKNLVFVVGLSQRLGDTEVLKKHDYFGKFGKIIKVVINQSTSYAGSSGPSASAYITYQKPEDALRAIQSVNNIHVDGRTLKASLGTTKYCSHFLRGTQCPKGDCMYLHELGDESASFTKDEMQQGKHQEYETKLYETYMNHLNNSTTSAATTTGTAAVTVTSGGATAATNSSTHTSTTAKTKHSTHSTGRKKTSSPALHGSTQSPPLSGSHTPTEAWPSLTTGLASRGGTGDTKTHATTGSHDLHNTDNSQRPSPPLDSCSTLSSSSGSHSSSQNRSPPQLSPTGGGSDSPQPQQPSSTTTAQTQPPNLPSLQTHLHTQAPVSRKPLYGTTDASNNMSLFSSSGFPVTRNPSKPPAQCTQQANAIPQSLESSLSIANSTSPHNPTEQTHTLEIPDTISVTSSTDWQKAFGFESSTITNNTTTVPQPPSQHPTSQHQPAARSHLLGLMSNATGANHHNSVNLDVSGDDDLGFDPWNESTKALQDLIESESNNNHNSTQHQYNNPQHHLAPGHQQQLLNHHLQQQPAPQGFLNNIQQLMPNSLNSNHQQQHNNLGASSSNHIQQQQLQSNMLKHQSQHGINSAHHTLGQQNSLHSDHMNHFGANSQQSQLDRNKALPPGFTQNHLTSAFTTNPVLGGSRMMNLMKLPPQSSSLSPTSASQQPAYDPHFSNPLQPPQHSAQPPHNFGNSSGDPFSMKLWQEELRALLPANINVHFGHLQQGSLGGGMLGHMTQQQNMAGPPHSLQMQRQHHSAHNSWDVSFDPAILTASGADHGAPQLLADEQPHWLASLQQLTEEPNSNAPQQQQQRNNHLLPAGHIYNSGGNSNNPITANNTSPTSQSVAAVAAFGLKQLQHNAAAAAAFAAVAQQQQNPGLVAASNSSLNSSASSNSSTAPPPGFQGTTGTTLMRPTHQPLPAAGGVEAHKLIDGFQ